MRDKGAKETGTCRVFSCVACPETPKPRIPLLGGGGTVKGHSGDKSANVGRSHKNNASPLWDLVEMQL